MGRTPTCGQRDLGDGARGVNWPGYEIPKTVAEDLSKKRILHHEPTSGCGEKLLTEEDGASD